MDFLQNATDSQIAVVGCIAALGGSFGLLVLSFCFGARARQESEQTPIAGRIQSQVSNSGEQIERKAA